MEAYSEYKKISPATSFSDWKAAHGHRGQVYFYDSYHHLDRAKPWIFRKDFP
jgi:hypothetical protein